MDLRQEKRDREISLASDKTEIIGIYLQVGDSHSEQIDVMSIGLVPESMCSRSWKRKTNKLFHQVHLFKLK